MPMEINFVPEMWQGGPSQPFHPAGAHYQYRKASSLTDLPARLTPRQAVFYRDLIRLAEALQSPHLPIDFIDAAGSHIAMDLGCVKIAEHAGFIEPLTDDSSGHLKTISLAWAVRPNSE